jgi:hypothetical protein
MIMPRLAIGVMIDQSVVSCPPWDVATEVKAEPTLSTSRPLFQSGPVWSNRSLSSAAMTPYRVGAPNTSAS